MSPELDRLVAAAEGAYQDARLPNEVLSQRTTQAILRAVLMALREPSRAMKDAASYVEVESDYPQSFTLPPKQAAEAFTAMIDHILGGSAVIRDEDGDVLVPSGVSAAVQGATAFISGPAPDASYIVGKPDRFR